MTQDTRITAAIRYSAIAGCLLIFILLVLMRGCESKPQLVENNYDSLINVLKAQDKYIGIREIEYKQANDARIKAENALRDRKPIYITRVERIVANAPDTCKEYLIAVKQECDTMAQKYQAVIDSTKEELCKAEEAKDAYKDKTETLQHFNNKLTDENKELTKDNKKLTRKNKVAKFFNKVLVGAAVAFTGVVIYFTMFK